jgi:hypothetical protein
VGLLLLVLLLLQLEVGGKLWKDSVSIKVFHHADSAARAKQRVSPVSDPACCTSRVIPAELMVV